ncbi:MAG: DUF262 domain-containing protein [bacterium]|nr:DUF262 domain-containing protein [bacterium]
MAKQIEHNPSTMRISQIYGRLNALEPTLILQPSFQRKFVWGREHKEKFIETLLRGLPIPEIYIAQSGIDLEKIEAQDVVVDGQQRLSTIVQYINEPEDSIEFGKIVKKYKDLDEDTKKDFLNYKIAVRDLGDIDTETIKEIFKRINYTQYGLNQVELHNAVYDGEFINTAKIILDSIKGFNFTFFTESQISRMEDLYYILLLLSTIEHGGYFSLDKEIEKYIIKFNDTYENKEMVMEKFISIFHLFEKLNLPLDSIWYRKSNFFTLFVEIYNSNKSIDISTLVSELSSFEKDILKNKELGREDNDYSKYYSYMFTGTNNRNARVIRSELFKKYVLDNI